MPLESQHLEFKRELTDSLEREVVGFLNSRDGGHIRVGVDDDGTVVGLSNAHDDQLRIKDRLKHNIQPSCMGLFDVLLEEEGDKNWIRLVVAGGKEKPYYLRKLGMSPRGCFLRVGSATDPMTARQIDELFASRTRNSLGLIASPRQNLRFTQLQIYYQGAGLQPGPLFTRNLELEREDGSFNLAAFLLADANSVSIRFAKYSGVDRVGLTENEEFGNCCLVKAANQLLDRLEVENRTLSRITPRQREDRKNFDPVAIREAVINAIVHNDYSYDGSPKVELFADRLEITSTGGIPRGLSEQEFLDGYSMPVNKELMRVFRDLDMVEHLGSGIPRILRAYSPECFQFTENFVRIVFPAGVKTVSTTQENDSTTQETIREGRPTTQENGTTTQETTLEGNDTTQENDSTTQETTREGRPTTQENDSATQETIQKIDTTTQEKLIEILRMDSTATRESLAAELGITPDGVKYHLDRLRKAGRIQRLGSTKAGRWEVLD